MSARALARALARAPRALAPTSGVVRARWTLEHILPRDGGFARAGIELCHIDAYARAGRFTRNYCFRTLSAASAATPPASPAASAKVQKVEENEDEDEDVEKDSRRQRIKGERNFNAPNALCVGRIAAGPALAYGVASGAAPGLVLAGVCAAAATDYLDGFLARRWNQSTILGSYLDPIADKVFVGCVGTALALDGALPVWLVALLVSRDVIHVVGGAWRRAGALNWTWTTTGEFLGFDDVPVARPKPTGAAALAGFDFDLDEVEQLGSKRGALRPLFIGKVNTAMQMALIAAAVCEPVLAAHSAPEYIAPALEFATDKATRVALEYATAASAVVATAEYARIFLSHPGFEKLRERKALVRALARRRKSVRDSSRSS